MNWKERMKKNQGPKTVEGMMVHRTTGQVMPSEAVLSGIRIGVYRAQDWSPVPAGIPLSVDPKAQ